MPVVYKCKECGGKIEPKENGLGKCLYCGAVQTLPKEKDDRISNLLNRANDFRLNCDFDRAIFEYEKVLELSQSEPEAHWGLFLSRYGVEYVKDNMTFTYKPTLHRISSISVFDDVDYQATIKYASPMATVQYKQKAEDIETVMKEFLLLSANQEPYDIFLSYKEADDTTRQRTDDSYLAYDLYNELTAQGYKVFFAPKSLGVGLYEPKIYAAIISAKVMIVLGTKSQYFDAVWVKNEWSRFAELIENGENKVLVPVFKNMNAENLPSRLAKYQAYDMANISFLPTLLNIISETLGNTKSRVNFNKDATAEDAYLERGFLALEDGNFSQANSFFENALNLNPHNSQAYFGKLLGEMKITKQEQILTSPKYLSEYNNFEKAVRFADHHLKTTLLQYEQTVAQTLNEQKYNALRRSLSGFKEESELPEIIEGFRGLHDFKKSSWYVSTLTAQLEELQSLQQETKELAERETKDQDQLSTLQGKMKFELGECYLFKILGGIAGVVLTVMTAIEGWRDSWIFGAFGALVIGGIVFIGLGLLAGFILDLTLGNLILWIIHRIRTRGIPSEIVSLQQNISETEASIQTRNSQCEEICDEITNSATAD